MRLNFLPLLICMLFYASAGNTQTVAKKLKAAWAPLEKDPQLTSGIASLYVMDAQTGAVVFEANGKVGLAPASTQKVITAATAYALLGAGFRYTTTFGYQGTIEAGNLKGNIIIRPSGDPTLGSWRWSQTGEAAVAGRAASAVRQLGVRRYVGTILDATGWEDEAIPDGWIWQDIGNYYGAGAEPLNWRENQYDMMLRSGTNVGDPVTVVDTRPQLYGYGFESELRAAPAGTGDNAYIYFPRKGSRGIVRGTIPVSQSRFTISGAMPSGGHQFLSTLTDSLSRSGVLKLSDFQVIDGFSAGKGAAITKTDMIPFHTETSPPLDSISYWFLRRSINLYGEALVKTIAAKKGRATTENGIELLQAFWEGQGLPKTELNMVDGSGLSPLNRVTTHAQVAVLAYARRQDWFAGYFHGFPEFNGMKMKSGTIRGAKGFCGYHTAKDGKEYIFSILVNNYSGPASQIVQKMYKVLDVLK